MGLQSKIQELAARFALDLVTAFRGATLEDIRSISGIMPQNDEPPKRPRRKRSWRRIRRFRK
jgi:hypothetical protein